MPNIKSLDTDINAMQTISFLLQENNVRVISVGIAVSALIGYKTNDFIDSRLCFSSLIHADDKDLADELFSLRPQQNLKTINLRLRHAAGKIICLKGCYQKQQDPSLKGMQLQLQLNDAKKLRQELNDQVLVSSFNSMMDDSQDYIYFKDRNHVFIGASETLVKLTNPSINRQDLIGLTDYDVFPETYADNYYRLEKQVFSGHAEVCQEQQQTLDNEGNIGWVDNRKYPIKDQSGNIIGLFGIARDITAIVETQLALTQSEKRFRDIFDRSPDPCWIIENNRFIQCNNAAVAVLEYPDKTSLLSHPSELSPEFQADGQCSFDKANQMMAIALEKKVHRFEWIHKRYDGCCFPVEVTLARIKINGNYVLYCVWQDITERKQAEQQLRESERLLRTIFEQAGVGVAIITTATGEFERVNQRYCEIVGYNSAEMTGGMNFQQITHPDDLEDDLNNMARLIAREITEFSMEKRYFHKEGHIVWVNLTVSAAWQSGDPALHHIAVVEDISQRIEEEQKLRLSAKVFSSAMEGILVTDAEGTIVDVNQAFSTLTGYSREEVLGQNPRILKSEQQNSAFYADMWQQLQDTGLWRGEVWNKKKNGQEYAELLTISGIRNAHDELTHYVGLFSDITDAKQQQLKLEHIAHFDLLTGLPNRVLLQDRLQQALNHHHRTGKTLAICFLDLDGFKSVNDNLGHKAGDQLLQEITQRMTNTVRSDDTVARVGGDEFVLLLGDFDTSYEYEVLLHRLLESIAMPFQILGGTVQVSASIGVTFYPGDQSDADLLLRHADQAMYEAKTSGKGRYHIFDPAIELRMHANATLVEKIDQALTEGQLLVYYQPQVDCRENKVVGMEALLRWNHPLLGIRTAGEFLPIVEHDPLIIKIGEWVTQQVLSQLQSWSEQNIELNISINIAAKQLLEGDFVSRLGKQLQRYPKHIWSKLKIEVTETAALDDLSVISHLIEECKAQFQIEFSLDDFGTGYSSLMQLKRMAANELKIDKNFVDDILQDPNDLAIVKGIVSLADAFQQHVVAEGVESTEQLKMLLELGCDIIQGYCMARPMPAEQAMQWVLNYQDNH